MVGHDATSSPMSNRQQSSWWPSQSPSAATVATSWVAGWRLTQPCTRTTLTCTDVHDNEIETTRIDVTPESETSRSEVALALI